MSLQYAMEFAIAVMVLVQSFEQLALNKAFSPQGGWRWSTIKKDFPSNLLVDLFFGKIIPHPAFSGSRILAALLLCFYPHCFVSGFLLLTSLLLIMRWRGNFNGGSDHMSLILQACLFIIHLAPQTVWSQGAMLYAGLQCLLSYFISGWIKIKRPNWRNGSALKKFLSLSSYAPPSFLLALLEKHKALFLLSWGAMLFELSAVLVLFVPGYLGIFIAMGIIFHLGNFYFLGLNRFVFTWIASYPALIYLVSFLR